MSQYKNIKISNSKNKPGYSSMKISNIIELVDVCNDMVKKLSYNKIKDLKYSIHGIICIMMSYIASIKKSTLIMRNSDKNKNKNNEIYTIYQCELYVINYFQSSCHYANTIRYIKPYKEFIYSRYFKNVLPCDFYDTKEYKEYKDVMENHIYNSIKLNKDIIINPTLELFAHIIYDYVEFILLFIKNNMYEKINELKCFKMFIDNRRILNIDIESYETWIKSFIVNFIHININKNKNIINKNDGT